MLWICGGLMRWMAYWKLTATAGKRGVVYCVYTDSVFK